MSVQRVHPVLPIFRLDDHGRSFVYAPGQAWALRDTQAEDLSQRLSTGAEALQKLPAIGQVIVSRALEGRRAWEVLRTAPYAPVALTIYLSHDCNLRCDYCFASAERATVIRSTAASRGDCGRELRVRRGRIVGVDPDAVSRAAEIVAGHCLERNLPMTVAFHGGGEPTLTWALLQELVALTRHIASSHALPWWGYIATNGLVSEAKARWLAHEFDHIGLSCDGPADLHDVLRPTSSGSASLATVLRTGRTFARVGTPFDVRATLARASLGRLSEIVRFVAESFGPRMIRVEPAYSVGAKPGLEFTFADAGPFVSEFLAAQELASSLGCGLSTSGARPEEIHGPYCNVLRDVLLVTPEGSASACFAAASASSASTRGLCLGSLTEANGAAEIDTAGARRIRTAATEIPASCEDCVNSYHCVRGCPDSCPAASTSIVRPHPSQFRCAVWQGLTEAWIAANASDEQGVDLESA